MRNATGIRASAGETSREQRAMSKGKKAKGMGTRFLRVTGKKINFVRRVRR